MREINFAGNLLKLWKELDADGSGSPGRGKNLFYITEEVVGIRVFMKYILETFIVSSTVGYRPKYAIYIIS